MEAQPQEQQQQEELDDQNNCNQQQQQQHHQQQIPHMQLQAEENEQWLVQDVRQHCRREQQQPLQQIQWVLRAQQMSQDHTTGHTEHPLLLTEYNIYADGYIGPLASWVNTLQHTGGVQRWNTKGRHWWQPYGNRY
jgi:hypothetical protein